VRTATRDLTQNEGGYRPQSSTSATTERGRVGRRGHSAGSPNIRDLTIAITVGNVDTYFPDLALDERYVVEWLTAMTMPLPHTLAC
jgi:hypothetical protein